MKRAACIVLTALFLFSLASCTAGGPAVNGVRTDSEVYSYFLDFTKDENGENEEAAKQALVRYVAVNSEFAGRKMTLSVTEKAELSQTVNDLWHLYGGYYENIGVSKQTLYKIEMSKAYEKSLLAEYYGEDGAEPVTEEELKSFFDGHYAGIRLVTGYLFNVDDNGAPVDMTEDQKNNLKGTFESIAEMVNKGTSMEEAVGVLGENTEIHDMVVSSFSAGNFPEGFFDKVKEVETGKAAAITLSDYVFLVVKVDPYSEDYMYYETYRRECLENMKGDDFDKVVENWVKNYTVD